MSRTVFLAMRRVFNLALRSAHTYVERDGILALYAPFCLLSLPPWLSIILLGYMGMYWALSVPPWNAFRVSGSSLLTLGIQSLDGIPGTLLMFSESVIGLIMVALLIAYLPTMCSAFSKREALVTLLEAPSRKSPRNSISPEKQPSARCMPICWQSKCRSRALLGIAGFRHPDYLQRKAWKLRAAERSAEQRLALSCLHVPVFQNLDAGLNEAARTIR